MNFNCPYCRKELNLMELQLESDLIAIIRMHGAFGKNGNLVWGYVSLFGISPLKMKTKKLRVLLEEIKRLFETEAFTYQKKVYRISRAGISEALDIVVKRNFETPLDSHNYLKRVMVGISEKEAQADGKQAEKGLREKEKRLQMGDRDPGDLTRIKNIIQDIG